MKFFKKTQNLNVFWKKVIVFLVIIGVGTPLVFLVGKDFQERIKAFNKREFLEKLSFKEVKKEMENDWGKGIKEKMAELKEMIEELGRVSQQAPTSTTSTISTDHQ